MWRTAALALAVAVSLWGQSAGAARRPRPAMPPPAAAADPASVDAPPVVVDLYTRLDSKLAANPALAQALGRPAPQMAQVAWMLGRWEVRAEVVGKGVRQAGISLVTPALGGVWLEIRDAYPNGVQDIGYLGFDLATQRWVSLSLDNLVNGNKAVGRGWTGNTLTLDGRVIIVGEVARLRQVMEKVSDTEYTLTNQEQVDGGWKVLDHYRYRKVP